MVMKRIFVILFAFSLLLTNTENAFAQNLSRGEVEVSNVEVNRIGTILYISYRLDFGSAVQSCVTELNISLDGGRTFSGLAKSDDLKGDIGRMVSAGKKEIEYDINRVKNSYVGKEIVFDVKAAHAVVLKPKVIALVGTTVYPFASSFGAMVGYADKFGGYLHYRTNFNNAKPTANYTCTSDGKTSDGGVFWGTGDSQVSMMNISAGAMMRISTWLYPYLGVGYGKRNVMWLDHESKLVEVTDNKYSGVTVEGGCIVCLGHFSFSLGASNLASTNGFGLELGVGLNF